VNGVGYELKSIQNIAKVSFRHRFGNQFLYCPYVSAFDGLGNFSSFLHSRRAKIQPRHNNSPSATYYRYEDTSKPWIVLPISHKIREFFSSSAKRSPFSNNLLAMPLITSMLLVATIVLSYLQTRGGVPTGSFPSSDPFLDFLKVSRAPLVEEIIFRIIPIGAFLVTYVFIAGKRTRPNFSWSQRLKTIILSVFQPEKAKEIVGLKTIGKHGLFGGVIWAEWVMVSLTASLFGVAHYLGGWGPGKISQAAMSGAVFALAYLYYGVQAPILLHWYFNYYFTVFDLSSSYYSAEGDFAYFLAVSANVLLGILMWVAVMIFGIMTVFKVLRRKPKTIPFPESPAFTSN